MASVHPTAWLSAFPFLWLSGGQSVKGGAEGGPRFTPEGFFGLEIPENNMK